MASALLDRVVRWTTPSDSSVSSGYPLSSCMVPEGSIHRRWALGSTAAATPLHAKSQLATCSSGQPEVLSAAMMQLLTEALDDFDVPLDSSEGGIALGSSQQRLEQIHRYTPPATTQSGGTAPPRGPTSDHSTAVVAPTAGRADDAAHGGQPKRTQSCAWRSKLVTSGLRPMRHGLFKALYGSAVAGGVRAILQMVR